MNTVKIVDANQQLTELVNRATNTGELIILTADGKAKAVLLGVDAFEELLGMREYSQRELMPFDDLQKQFQEALREAGYDSHEKIVNLVQEIKREIATERQNNL
ncbi:type II toxin-antitoxin system Phd/YefM family antitoxin [Floridanema aerugineum]|uniref:Antitoxin n=1 Tax=Floridaenema aerugineum BLCC-F46 TaxID=3153654 RepID=A0ABV4X340_9CYAN